MIQLFAQPYDIDATGFFFVTSQEFDERSRKLLNPYGQPVEEFEIQFIDGSNLDYELFKALNLHQGSVAAFFEATDRWNTDQKIRVIIAVGEIGYAFDMAKDDPEQFELDLYEIGSLTDLARQFVDEGLFGLIPASIQNYIDYDAIARDLSMDYSQIHIDGICTPSAQVGQVDVNC